MKTSLKKLVENFANLVKVKTIITMVVLGIFAKLALAGGIPPEHVMQVTMLVIAFYFGTQTRKG